MCLPECRVQARAGHIDVLVNNGAIAHVSPIEHITDGAARAVFETNRSGPLRTIRAVLPGMRGLGSGSAVHCRPGCRRGVRRASWPRSRPRFSYWLTAPRVTLRASAIRAGGKSA